MVTPPNPIRDQSGNVLIVVSVLLLALLTILGVSSINTVKIGSRIAVNDHLYKMAFYEADGGTQTGIQLIEENLACPGGFSDEPTDIADFIRVGNRDFYTNATPNVTAAISICPSDTARDAYYPLGYTGNDPHTNLRFFGQVAYGAGSAIQMAAGYEGRGKGAGAGGGRLVYNIHAQRVGLRNSQSHVLARWRHVIGERGECRY
jgi:hypothetical protein